MNRWLARWVDEQSTAGDLRELPRVPLRGEGSCGGGGAPRDFFFKIFIYWAASGLSGGTWDLSLRHAGFPSCGDRLQGMGSVVAMLQLSCPVWPTVLSSFP